MKSSDGVSLRHWGGLGFPVPEKMKLSILAGFVDEDDCVAQYAEIALRYFRYSR